LTRRFLSLWFALLPTDRARALRRDKNASAPLATIARINSAQRLVGVDRRAASLGLHPGLSLADARARYPDLIAVDADPVEEARLLARIADWCARFTPLVALDGADGIMLDISGVAHLFEGEAKMAEAIEARLAGQGLGVALGIADAPRAAWALARFSSQRIAPAALSEKTFARLFHDMPAAALGLEEKTIADLARAGLRRVGDLAMRPRAPIAARFGADVMSRLDALSGLERGAISPRFAAPDFCAERRFASAIIHKPAVELAIAKLADDLVVLLERQAKGARRLELCLFRVDGALRRIQVGASRPLNEARAIARLFAERVEAQDEDEIDPGYGIDIMRLSCLSAEPLAPSQRELERAHEGERARALADLIDRLSARLGPRRVTRLEPVDTHIPEHAIVAVPATGKRSNGIGNRHCERQRSDPDEGTAAEAWSGLLRVARNDEKSSLARPIRLFERPERIEAIAEIPDGPPLRFRWRRVLHEIAAIEGPERIAPEWWRHEAALTRDYFRAEDKQGRRFWLYREGLYGRETVRWFVQGAMA
jgi:protein ImuB